MGETSKCNIQLNDQDEYIRGIKSAHVKQDEITFSVCFQTHIIFIMV